MTTFDSREQAFENQFAHDETLAFKTNALSVKMLGLWAAQKLGFTGEKAESYATSLVETDLDTAAHHDMMAQLATDLSPHGITDKQIQTEWNHFIAKARHQVMTELPKQAS